MANSFDPAMFDTASGRRLKPSCGPCDPGAEITVTPEFMYFGYIPPGALSDWQPLIVKNTGIVSVGIDKLVISGEFELVGEHPTTLVPGESTTYSVRFAPIGAGMEGGDIEIQSATVGAQPLIKLVGIGGELASAGPGGGEGVPWAYRYGTFAVGDILGDEILLDYHVTTGHRLQSNFAGCKVSVGTPPESDMILSVQLNNVEIGTITISSTGQVTMVTNGGVSVQVSINDILTVKAPATPQPALARLRMIFVGVI
jgi:hypothetical protein